MHFDWAMARGESNREIEQLGREVERMDREMEQIRTEIEELDRTRFTAAGMPLKSLKAHKI